MQVIRNTITSGLACECTIHKDSTDNKGIYYLIASTGYKYAKFVDIEVDSLNDNNLSNPGIKIKINYEGVFTWYQNYPGKAYDSYILDEISKNLFDANKESTKNTITDSINAAKQLHPDQFK